MKYPFCIIAVVLFLPFVHDFSYTAKIIYICCSYFIYGSLLSTVSIPYGAMSAAISSYPEDRVSLSTRAALGPPSVAGQPAFIPILMYTTLRTEAVISGQHFFWIAIGCSVLGFIF